MSQPSYTVEIFVPPPPGSHAPGQWETVYQGDDGMEALQAWLAYRDGRRCRLTWNSS